MVAILKLVCDSIMSMGLQNLQFPTKIEILVKNNNGTTKNRIAFISMAAFLYFSILGLIPHFDSVDPVLIGLSMLRTPYMQVFMLSSGSAHVGLLMLHIDSAIFSKSAQYFGLNHWCKLLEWPKVIVQYHSNIDRNHLRFPHWMISLLAQNYNCSYLQ